MERKPNSPILLKNKGGAIERCAENVRRILLSPEWAGVLRYDSFRQVTVIAKAPPFLKRDAREDVVGAEWTDDHTSLTHSYLAASHRLIASTTDIESVVGEVARRTLYHPIQNYFDGLLWDGTPRVGDFFSTYMGAESTEYTRGVSTCWLVSAAARVYVPGTQVDYLVVLCGAQGKGKNRVLRALFSEPFFSETGQDLESKDAILGLFGKLCVCFDELDSLRGKARVERVKNFLTRTHDHVRLPYAKRPVDIPRGCVFAATTNEEQFLSDMTGNRRFWPILCWLLDVEAVVRDRDQIWAEAVHLYKSGTLWYPDEALKQLCEKTQEDFREKHPWEDEIAEWVLRPTGGVAHTGFTTVTEILVDCLKLEVGRLNGPDGRLVGAILRKLGGKQARVMGKDAVKRTIFRFDSLGHINVTVNDNVRILPKLVITKPYINIDSVDTVLPNKKTSE